MDDGILNYSQTNIIEKKILIQWNTADQEKIFRSKEEKPIMSEEVKIKITSKSCFSNINEQTRSSLSLSKSDVLLANFNNKSYQTILLSSFNTNPVKQMHIKKIFEDGSNSNVISIIDYYPFIPERIYSTNNQNNNCIKITNQLKNLFLGLDTKELLINQSGLINHISSFNAFTIFGTNSYSLELLDMLSDCYEQDYIDIYMNYKTKDSYQCFYIHYNSSINSFIFSTLIDRESKLPKVFYKIDKLNLDFNKYYFILIGQTIVKIYFTRNPEKSPMTFISTKDEIKEVLSIETYTYGKNQNINQFYFRTYDTITLGSSKNNVILIKDDCSVSKRHCYIKYNQIEGEWVLFDGDYEKLSYSKNGTWQLLEKSTQLILSNSKYIKFDDFIFKIELV